MMISQINSTKFSPCQSCPSLASNIIDRYFSACLRQRKTPNSLTQRLMLHHQQQQHQQQQHFHHHHQLNSVIEGATAGSATFSGMSGGLHAGFASSTSTSVFNGGSGCMESGCFGGGGIVDGISPTSSLISFTNNLQSKKKPGRHHPHHHHHNHHSPSPSPPPNAAAAASSSAMIVDTTTCFYVNESHTFTLPSEIEDFSPKIQSILFDELLDREVQQELEYECRVINWNIDLCKRFSFILFYLLISFKTKFFYTTNTV